MGVSENIKLKASVSSDIGRRWNNEDAYLVNEGLGLFVVADGMGGHERGEVASWFTSDNLQKVIAYVKGGGGGTMDHLDSSISTASYEELLEYAVFIVNRKLYEENEKQLAEDSGKPGLADACIAELVARKKRMGTTLVSLLIRGNKAYITHVGDSRAYRIAAGSIERLTHDHSWVEERIREGVISPEEAKGHKKKNVITRSLGFRQEVEADIDTVTLYPPERFLLCSDGLSNVVKEKDLFAFAMIDDLEEACEQMVDLAKANGGKDNITAVLVDVGRTDAKGAVDWHRDRTHDVDDSTDL